MDNSSFLPSMWGVVKYGAVRVSADAERFVDLVVEKQFVRLRNNDPGISKLDFHRFKGKKAFVIFCQTPSGHNHIYAIYATDDKRFVALARAIIGDKKESKMERLKTHLSSKEARYSII